MYRLAVALILSAGLAWAAYAALDMPVSGKHLENEITCEDCHGTDEPAKRAPVSACYACHGEYPELAELTASMEVNPHASHQGEPRCTLCHKTHEPSVLFCNDCHAFEMTVK